MKEEIERIGKERTRWEKENAGKKGREQKIFTTSGIEVRTVYTPEDSGDANYLERLGFPGEYPFTRGVYPNMYQGRLWTMRQYSGMATAEASNARYKFLLNQGQTGLSVALDLPTQMGIDSDDELAEGDVGVVGVAIDTLKDMEILFDGIPLDKITTSFTINATAAILLAMYITVAEKQGVPIEKTGGTIQNDILKEYVSRGAWIFPIEPSVKMIGDTIEFCMERIPNFNPISISGAHFRGAGANAIQEVAFTFCDAIEYVNHMLQRGIDIDKFGPMLSFWFSTNIDIFEEVAKYRAARRLWAKIMKQRFGAKDPASLRLRFGTSTLGVSLTAQQPLNNIIRVAYEALGSVLGGVQSLFTASLDEAYSIPTKEAVQVALRTQQILADEAGVGRTVDPLGGSYYIEFLTDRLEEEITKLMAKVEEMGGMIKAIQEGYIQSMILDEAYDHERKLKSGEKIMVGVNKFVVDESGKKIDLYQIDPETSKRQIERLSQVKAERNATEVKSALERLKKATVDKKNVMPFLVESVKTYATIGEITSVLKEIYGTFREPVII
ncbi:methylmalonyl-CoA mutase [Patescibacteria group bacterium]|nr:methylmalonyl-CoA mutase [Patescibacteria group bacterium]